MGWSCFEITNVVKVLKGPNFSKTYLCRLFSYGQEFMFFVVINQKIDKINHRIPRNFQNQNLKAPGRRGTTERKILIASVHGHWMSISKKLINKKVV